MKWKTKVVKTEVTVVQPDLIGDIIRAIINLYLQIGWLAEVDEEDIVALIKDAEATEQQIIATGLNPKPHGRYRIGIIPGEAQWTLLHPTKMRMILRDLLGWTDCTDWGYVNSDYYGTSDAPRSNLTVDGKELPITHGFTTSDIGKVIFLTEDANAPGHNPEMPGSLLADMRWGENRDKAWTKWAEKLTSIAPKPLGYATHSLFWIADVAIGNWKDALGCEGHEGVYDYIGQPYDIQRRLCPYGNVFDVEAR